MSSENKEMIRFCAALTEVVKQAEGDCDKIGDGLETLIAANRERIDDYNLHNHKEKGDVYKAASKECSAKFGEIRDDIFSCNQKNDKVQQAIRDVPALH